MVRSSTRHMPLTQRSHVPVRPSARTASLAGALVLLAACASTRTNSGPKPPDREIKPIGKLVEDTNKPEPIGKLLTDINGSIKAWQNLFMTATTSEEKRKAQLLEQDIMRVSHARRVELVEQLESGPLNNRIVAAAALGFTRDREALSPLLAALDDSHEEVVGSALFGLWLLGDKDTPLDRICPLLQRGSEEMRTHAALCLSMLLEKGVQGDCAVAAARLGILDDAPTVRAQCALILAGQHDTGSLQSIADRLYDEKTLVVSAAARALMYLGTQDAHTKGLSARALVKAWLLAKEPAKGQIFKAMVELAGQNYGSDDKEWAKWADRLPSS